MPDGHIAIRASVEEDLLPLTALLRSRGVPHRIYEEGGRQVLEVFDPGHVAPVRELYRAWRAGEVRIEVRQGVAMDLRSRLQWRQSPVTAATAILCMAVFLVLLLGDPLGLLPALNYLPFEVVHGEPVFRSMGAQYWRLVTPALLHFGWLHIVFNLLWLWELGSRTERVVGSGNYLGILLVIAAVSNFCQHLASGAVLFGGMSGVVYGLLGFSAVAPHVQPAWPIRPPTPVLLFMLGWLMVCMSGLVEAVGFGAIANAAHLAGLVCGALLGLLFAGLSRL